MQKYDPNELTSHPSLCPNCRFPVSAEDTFCGECGFDLTQEGVETSFQTPAGEGPGGAETGALQARVGRFVASRSLRRSYFDLGLALKAQARYREAAEAFAQAQQAEGRTPRDVDIFLQQAFAYEHATNPERAFRTYLEAVRKNPDDADIVLPHIHRMVTPKIVLENGVWLVSEWAQSIDKIRVSPADRVQIAAFLGRIHLFLGQYEEALDAFQQALQADPQSAPAVVGPMLNPAALPPEFEPQANRGQAQFALARIWQALGNLDEALRIVELALSLDLGEGNYPEAPVQHL
jgi:tetratricopeptide (TPR) repeat protein